MLRVSNRLSSVAADMGSVMTAGAIAPLGSGPAARQVNRRLTQPQGLTARAVPPDAAQRQSISGRALTVAIVATLTLTACSGGGRDMSIDRGPALDDSTHAYSGTAAARHTYAPYLSPSSFYLSAIDEDYSVVTVGGDLAPKETLRHVATSGDIQYFLGQSRDGVGVARLENYVYDLRTSNEQDPFNFSNNGFFPFPVQPYLYLDDDFLLPENQHLLIALFNSVQILNDALPPEFQVFWAGSHPTGIADQGEILVRLDAPAEISALCGSGAVACANTRTLGDFAWSSVLRIPDDFDVSEYRRATTVLVHELLHAMGIQGHVDGVEFPDSIMGASGEFIPNLGFIISKIDREVLQIMYMSQLTDTYNDWGEWSDVAFHLMGKTEDDALQFGVALFNGLPQPWAKGQEPNSDLSDNRRLFGTATWNGNLLGFSGPSPIAGDAQLQVRLPELSNEDSEHDLRFRDIAFLNRFDSDDPWFHVRDIDYKVTISGNLVLNVLESGYEEGIVSGYFMGAEHEHMGGTVKRTDMVAAFGGSR